MFMIVFYVDNSKATCKDNDRHTIFFRRHGAIPVIAQLCVAEWLLYKLARAQSDLINALATRRKARLTHAALASQCGRDVGKGVPPLRSHRAEPRADCML
eukprot:5251502-Heterocapsa_arctica.AAC.1